jgi:hypothetical protein
LGRLRTLRDIGSGYRYASHSAAGMLDNLSYVYYDEKPLLASSSPAGIGHG